MNKALEVTIKMSGWQNNLSLAGRCNNIAYVCVEKGDYDKALEFYNKSIHILQNLLWESHPELAKGYHNIGGLYEKLADFQNATEYANKALSIYNHLFGLKHPRIAGIYNDITRIYLEQNAQNTSLTTIQNAILANVIAYDDSSIYTIPPTNNVFSAKTLLNTLKLKAAAFKQRSALHANDIENIKMALTNYRLAAELADDIRSSYTLSASKLVLGESISHTFDEALLASLHLYNLSKDEQDLMQAFIFAEKNKSAVLQQSLAENETLLNYAVGDTSLFIFTISKKNFQVVSVHIDSTFEQTVSEFTTAIKDYDNKLFLESSARLHNWLIEPVSQQIASKERLIIIPDGVLFYLPFEALVAGEETLIDKSGSVRQRNSTELDHLIKKYEVSRVKSREFGVPAFNIECV